MFPMEQTLGSNNKPIVDGTPAELTSNEQTNQEPCALDQLFIPTKPENRKVTTKGSGKAGSSTKSGQKAAQTNQMMMMQHDAIPPAKYNTMKEMTEDFWRERKRKMQQIPEAEMKTKSRNMSVPMARVKKIMRIDDDVRNFMIASDAPIFMAQAAELFIEEMTAMGWQYVSEARRRILQKTDIATAVQNNDQFDFLIDFLPAKVEEVQQPSFKPYGFNSGNASNIRSQNARNLENKRVSSGNTSKQQNHRFSSQGVRHRTSQNIEYDTSYASQAGPSTSTPSTSNSGNNFTIPAVPMTTIVRSKKGKASKR